MRGAKTEEELCLFELLRTEWKKQATHGIAVVFEKPEPKNEAEKMMLEKCDMQLERRGSAVQSKAKLTTTITAMMTTMKTKTSKTQRNRKIAAAWVHSGIVYVRSRKQTTPSATAAKPSSLYSCFFSIQIVVFSFTSQFVSMCLCVYLAV